MCPSTVTYARREFRRRSILDEIAHKELFQRALTFLQTGDVESAETGGVDLLQQYPEDANFLCLSARALVQLGRFPEANARIERALSINPDFAIAHEVRGEFFFAKGEMSAAVEEFQHALTLNPQREHTRMKLAQALLYTGQVDEAEDVETEIREASQDNQDIAKAADEEIISEKSGQDAKYLSKSRQKRPTDSAAKLFENIEDDDLDEEFEFDEKRLRGEDYGDNDVVSVSYTHLTLPTSDLV